MRAVVGPEAVLDVVCVPVVHRLPTGISKLAAHRRNALAALDVELDRPLPLLESVSHETSKPRTQVRIFVATPRCQWNRGRFTLREILHREVLVDGVPGNLELPGYLGD